MEFLKKIYISFITASAPNGRDKLVPNNVYQFGNMISCTTGLSEIKALADYNGYGCYCGLGGDGTALDKTDQ